MLRDEIINRMNVLTQVMKDGSLFELYPKNQDNHYNVFVLESFTFSALALKTLRPDAVPAETMARWEGVVRDGMRFQAENPEGQEKDGEYGIIPNIDARSMVMLESAARLLGDSTLSEKAQRLLQTVEANRLPDGAFHYYAGENECFSYHESVIRDLARFHFLTGSEKPAALIAASKNYYPLSMEPGGVSEYSSAPHWKAFWNGTGMVAAPSIVAWFSKDPVNRGIALDQLRRNPKMETVYNADLLIAAACYDPEGPVSPQPGDGLIPDANIGGFRGRFGRFSFLADARDRRRQNEPHQGRATYVGALVTDDDARFRPFNSALLRVNSNVRFDAKRPPWQGSGYLSHNSTDSVSMTRDHGGLSARYELGSADYGPRFLPMTGWEGREAWLFSKDRIIGFVELEATTDASADEVSGRVALGYGRNGPGLIPKSVITLADGTFAFGDLRVRIAEHNYPELSIDPAVPYFRDIAPLASEIIVSEKSTDGRLLFPKGSRRYFVVEIYPAWAVPATPAGFTIAENGLVTLSDGHSTLCFNSSAAPLAFFAPSPGSVVAASSRLPSPEQPTTAGQEILIAPFGHVIFTPNGG